MLRCAITPGELALEPDPERRVLATQRLAEGCGELARKGIDLLLVREKKLSAGELVRVVRSVVDAARGTNARVLVAQRVDVSLAAGAHGVHLSAADGELSPAQVRLLMPAAFTSVSCHMLEQVRAGASQGPDLILFAPVFGKWVEGRPVSEGVGLEKLAEAAQAAAGVPVLALGGVTPQNSRACCEAGAAGIAGIRLFFC